jgi:hypothetical protein
MRLLEQGIDEGRYGAAAGENEQAAEEQQHQDKRQKPEFFPCFQKAPEIGEKVRSS